MGSASCYFVFQKNSIEEVEKKLFMDKINTDIYPETFCNDNKCCIDYIEKNYKEYIKRGMDG